MTALFLDTSVLIDHLRGRATPHVLELHRRLGLQSVVIGDLVLTEVLQGIREPGTLRATEKALAAFGCRDLGGARRARTAAQVYRHLRAGGVTPRSTIDVLIASFCVEEGLELLASDRDYRLMAPLLELRLWEPPLN